LSGAHLLLVDMPFATDDYYKARHFGRAGADFSEEL
jgi:hypothetical protein